jgi:N2227-like protein
VQQRLLFPLPAAEPTIAQGACLCQADSISLTTCMSSSIRLVHFPQGYETQGNEHSWFMLISSAFMLNGAEAAGQFTIHPWVASSNNQPSTAAQLRGVISLLLAIVPC